MRKVENELTEKAGKVVGGRPIWNIRYADDTTLIANTKEELKAMAEHLRDVSKEYGLSLNTKKTTSDSARQRRHHDWRRQDRKCMQI